MEVLALEFVPLDHLPCLEVLSVLLLMDNQQKPVILRLASLKIVSGARGANTLLATSLVVLVLLKELEQKSRK